MGKAQSKQKHIHSSPATNSLFPREGLTFAALWNHLKVFKNAYALDPTLSDSELIALVSSLGSGFFKFMFQLD